MTSTENAFEWPEFNWIEIEADVITGSCGSFEPCNPDEPCTPPQDEETNPWG